MPVMVRVGAVHLGRDVVSVAAGGGRVPIRPVRVEGSYITPAYLLADSSGRLHTAGVDRQQQGLGRAIDDVRDIIGHPRIVIAGATWPAELVFRARLYNPLASMGDYLRGKPDVVALPYPDGWPDEKVDLYCALVEQLDVEVEPIPESIALSGYVRALGLVRSPDAVNPQGIGATGVYSDGHTALVVAVHGDDQQPTESVELPLSREATGTAQAADDAVLEVMAAARSIGADTSTVLLAGNARFNEPLWHAFRNHLGHRFQHADHAIHALVLGAAHLLLSENDSAEPASTGRHAEPAAPPPVRPDAAPHPPQPSPPQRPPGPPQPPAPGPEAMRPAPDPGRPHPHGPEGGRIPGAGNGPAQRPAGPDTGPPGQNFPQGGPSYPPLTGQEGGGPTGPGPHTGPTSYGSVAAQPPAAPMSGPDSEMTVKVGPGDTSRGLPPNLAQLGSRFTRPPGTAPDDQRPAPGRPGRPGTGEQGRSSHAEGEASQGRGMIWNKMKGNVFGAPAVAGAVALTLGAVGASLPEGETIELASAVSGFGYSAAGCALTPRISLEPQVDPAPEERAEAPGETGSTPVHARAQLDDQGAPQRERASSATDDSATPDCAHPDIDTLRFLIPGPPGAVDPGPPIDI